MAEVRLEANVRERTGKGAARQARLNGKVPGTLYGRGMTPISLEVSRRDLITAFRTDAGMNVLLDLEVGGNTTLAIARDLQRDPVRGTLLHADFVKVDRSQEIDAEVPVHLVGEAPGAKEGGVLEQPLFALHIRCTVTDVPDSIDADVSGLEIGDALRISDLSIGDYQILHEPDDVVASVAQPISEEELEAMEAEAGVEQEEPTVEGEEGEEGEGGAEEGAAAEQPAEASEAPSGGSEESE